MTEQTTSPTKRDTLNIRGEVQKRIGEIILNVIDMFSPRSRRIDARRFLPLFVIGLFIAVTITHEAYYAGSFEQEQYRLIGWSYAIAINLSILVTEYFTRWKTTRRWAWLAFCTATIGSGMMNIAYIRPWELVNVNSLFAWVYATLPTIIITLLGFLASNVSKLAGAQESRWRTQEERSIEKHVCFCGESFSRPIELAQHTREHIGEIQRAEEKKEFSGTLGAIEYLKRRYPNVDKEQLPDVNTIAKWRK